MTEGFLEEWYLMDYFVYFLSGMEETHIILHTAVFSVPSEETAVLIQGI